MKKNVYFKSVLSAQRAYSQLEKMGVEGLTMDIIDRFSMDNNNRKTGVYSSEDGSLSRLVLNVEEGSIPMEQRPLYAADPNVSGMGKFSEVSDANVIISLSGADLEKEGVAEVIRQNEGEI